MGWDRSQAGLREGQQGAGFERIELCSNANVTWCIPVRRRYRRCISCRVRRAEQWLSLVFQEVSLTKEERIHRSKALLHKNFGITLVLVMLKWIYESKRRALP